MIISKLSDVKPDFKRIIEDVPELGEGAQIILQEFSADMASEFNEALIRNNMTISTTSPDGATLRKTVMFYCSLICCSAVNESGERISSSEEAPALLRAWDQDLILRIGDLAADLNGFTSKKKDEEKKDLPVSQQPQSSEELP